MRTREEFDRQLRNTQGVEDHIILLIETIREILLSQGKGEEVTEAELDAALIAACECGQFDRSDPPNPYECPLHP